VAALSQSAAIAGLGGIGKTQTAIEYAYRYFYDESIYEWAFWVRADTELNIVTGLAELARSLDLGEGKLDELAERARRWLETHDRWLLIFDNADDPKLLEPWMPKNLQGRVLLTSRAKRFVSLGIKAPIELKAFSQQGSIEFLQERCDRVSLDAAELAALAALAQELAGLPLALEQAGAYLQRMKVSFAVYWRHYQQRRLELLERGQPETGEYPMSVATTWLLNFEQVEQKSPASVPILRLSSVLAGDEIDEQLLLVCAKEFGLTDCTDELALAEQLAALEDFSLIARERETVSYGIHRMVQAVVWQGLTAAEQQDWMLRAIAGLSAAFPDVSKFENWAMCGRLVPHVQAITARQSAETLETTNWALLLSQAGRYLNGQERYEAAEPLFLQALELWRSLLGEQHPAVATSLDDLAMLYRLQGHYEEAEPLNLQALELRRSLLGEQHFAVAGSLNNLALLYKSQGRYEKAEPLYLQALELWRSLLGEQHLVMATSLNNLAGLYRSQGRYEAAEPLCLQALELWRSLLGEQHLAVAGGLNNLALLYDSQGRYEKAEPLYLQALELMRSLLRESHPAVADSLNSLAELYRAQGRYEEAEPLYLQALQLRRSLLGESHPAVAMSLNNLAVLYANQGRLTEAEPLLVQALELRQQRLGHQHPDTVMTRQSLENLRQMIGKAHDEG